MGTHLSFIFRGSFTHILGGWKKTFIFPWVVWGFPGNSLEDHWVCWIMINWFLIGRPWLDYTLLDEDIMSHCKVFLPPAPWNETVIGLEWWYPWDGTCNSQSHIHIISYYTVSYTPFYSMFILATVYPFLKGSLGGLNSKGTIPRVPPFSLWNRGFDHCSRDGQRYPSLILFMSWIHG